MSLFNLSCASTVTERISLASWGRRGIGADLLASGIDWMLSAPTTKKINLTVHADNVAARSLYEPFGFITERVMRGYRKRVG